MAVPCITDLRVIPVAGRESMLLNLSGAHGPFFTGNLVILTHGKGRTGVGEVPGGVEDARGMLADWPIAQHLQLLQQVRNGFADRDVGGGGLQTFQ